MNAEFLNRLADVLEALPPHVLDPQGDPDTEDPDDDASLLPYDLPRLDRFRMLGDAVDDTLDTPFLPDGDLNVGGLEAWAAFLAARDRGLDLPVPHDAVSALAAHAAGLPPPPDGTRLTPRTSALFCPPALFGRMDAVTPQHAAYVLRRCAEGEDPHLAWDVIGRVIRHARLLNLAATIERLPLTPMTRLFPVRIVIGDWQVTDLRDRLAYYEPVWRHEPYVLDDDRDRWCGDAALWTIKLFACPAAPQLHWLKDEAPDLYAAQLLGLTPLESVLLFHEIPEPHRRSALIGDDDPTDEGTAQSARDMAELLRGLAAGALPGIYWPDAAGLEFSKTSYRRP